MVQNLRFGGEKTPIHAGRYRLAVSPTCPFCRRVTIAYRILGLSQAISASYATGQESDGFVFESPGHSYNLELGARTNRELYRHQPDWEDGGSTSIPVVIDEQNGRRIVARESAEILQDFVTVWRPFWKFKAPDLYPEKYRAEIDKLIKWLQPAIVIPITKALHQAPFALSEETKNNLAQLDERLEKQGFLIYAEASIADLHLFSHLCSARALQADVLSEFKNLQGFVDRQFADPLWVSEAERAVLDPAKPSFQNSPVVADDEHVGGACSL